MGRYISPAIPIVMLVLLLSLSGCGGSRSTGGDNGDSGDTSDSSGSSSAVVRIRIAEQYGLAYAPLVLIRDVAIPGVELEWVQLSNAAAIREAMIAGRLDVGFMGIPPYLIGRDRGMEWTAFTALSRAPLGLVTLDPAIASLADLIAAGGGAQIALPQPGSIQHILLAMALERGFGDPRLLDNRIISMGHPDGMNALLATAARGGAGRSGGISAHFTAPPYLFQELSQPGARQILSGDEAFGGPFTFIVGVLAPGITSDDPAIVALSAALKTASARITALQRMLQETDGALPPQNLLTTLATFYQIHEVQLAEYLVQPGLVYEEEIRGLAAFTDTMRDYGYLTETAN